MSFCAKNKKMMKAVYTKTYICDAIFVFISLRCVEDSKKLVDTGTRKKLASLEENFSFSIILVNCFVIYIIIFLNFKFFRKLHCTQLKVFLFWIMMESALCPG